MKTQYEYIEFREFQIPGRKTPSWNCISLRHEFLLGKIMWYGPWRQHCFYPEKDTVFNKGCLEDINDFLDQVKKQRLHPESTD